MKKDKTFITPKRRKATKETTSFNEESKVADITKGVSILNNYQEEKNKERRQRIKEAKNGVQNISRKKMNLNIRPIIAIFVIILLVFGLYLAYWYGPMFGISIHRNDKIDEKKRIDIVSTDQDIYKMYNEQLLVYSNQVVRLYNSNSEQIFEYKLPEIFVPEIYTKGRFMCILNKAKGKIYLFENNNEILNKKIEGEVKTVYLDEKGNFVVEYSNTGYRRILSLFNKDGKETFKTHIGDSGINDLIILENGHKLLVVEIDTSSLTVGTSIKIIDTTKQSDNIKEIANIENSLVQNLTIQGQDIIMLLDSKIIKCNISTGNMTKVKDFNNTQISHIEISSSYYVLLGDTQVDTNSQIHNYKINMVGYDSKNISEGIIVNIPKYIKNSGLLTYLVYQDRLQIKNKWGMLVKDIPLDYSLKDIVIFGSEKTFALVYTNKIYVVNL